MSGAIQSVYCSWFLRAGDVPKANQRLTIVDGVLQEVIDVPADERSMIQPMAVLPGLVNAHTHLEFSHLSDPLQPPNPFPDWIKSVVQYRQQDLATDTAITSAVCTGFAESRSAGTSIVGEICTSATGQRALQTAVEIGAGQPSAVCFRELIGFTENRIPELKHLADEFVSSFEDSAAETSSRVLPGLSPHAPYSVHPDVVAHVCAESKQRQFPVAMHLAETIDEIQFVESSSGRFVDFLANLGLWQPKSLAEISGIADYLTLLRTCSHALAIHGNYLRPADIKLLGNSPNVTSVYCVRTHEWFGHSVHPWQQIEEAGGSVILGTDSRASNPDLSVWKELQRFCQLFPSQSMIKRLPMISTDAASAVGLHAEDFNLTVGKPVRATCVEVDAATESLLESSLLKATTVQVLEVD